jgi:hypothetical protein
MSGNTDGRKFAHVTKGAVTNLRGTEATLLKEQREVVASVKSAYVHL